MSDETQPLKLLEAPTREEELERARKAWNDQLHHSLQQAMIGVRAESAMPLPLPDPHIHGPFTFIMNQNHNALRGCTTCGAAWVGLMAGKPHTLPLDPVAEIEEEEEE